MAQSLTTTREVLSDGRVSIPKELRTRLGIEKGDLVEIQVEKVEDEA